MKSLKKKNKCAFCCAPLIFSDFEKVRDYKMDDFDFLKEYRLELALHLIKVCNVNKTATKCFLNDEHTYSGHDWYTREEWSVA